MIKIIITDDDKLVALSLKTILESSGEIEITAIGSSGEEAVRLYKENKPDVMLMDIHMQGITGLEAGERILRTDKNARILYLTTFSDDDYIIKALDIGAKGYILKQDFEGIVPAVKAIMNGQSVFGERVISRIPQLMSGDKDGGKSASAERQSFDYGLAKITETEFEIIKLVSAGLSNKEISLRLYLSEGTVRNYLSDIFEKLNVRGRTQLAVFYYTNGELGRAD